MKVRSIRFNFLMNCILTLSSIIFPLITTPYVYPILTPKGVGKLAVVNSIITYFSMFAQLGIPTYGIRACVKVRGDKTELTRVVHEILFINIIMTTLVYAVFFAALAFVPRLREDRTLFLVTSSAIILNAIGAEWLYKALEQYTYIAVRSLVFKVIAVAAMFAFIHEEKDYVIYGGISVLAAYGSNAVNLFYLKKYIYLHPVGRYCYRRHIKPILVFFAMSVATTVYTNLDKIMLGTMLGSARGDAEAGYYEASVKIKNILVSIVTSLGTVLLPRASGLVESGNFKQFMNISKKAIYLVLFASFPITVYFTMFSKEAILFLSGEDFLSSVLPMQIIMPTVILIGLTNIMGIQMLLPLGMEKQVLYSEIVGAVIDLLFNFVLIPTYGAAGAAIGTLLAEFSVLIVQAYALRDRIFTLARSIKIRKLIAAVLAASVGSVWVKNLNMGNFFILLYSAILFFTVYGIILLALREDFMCEMAGNILKKLRRSKR